MLLAGLRVHHAFAESPTTIPPQWAQFERLLPLPGQVGATTYGAMCGTDHAAQRFEYMTAVEVERFEELPPGIGKMRVPAAHYAVFSHRGHVSELRGVWEAIWSRWVPTCGYKPAPTPDFERYGEGFDPVTKTGDMEIWFPVVRSG